MDRRDLLRVLSVAGALLAMPGSDGTSTTSRTGASCDLAEHEQFNEHLWEVFALARSKRLMYPLVHEQLGQLTKELERSHSAATHKRLCTLAGDLFQLAGEICFDSNHYTDAAQCYSLAASASKEASSYDLWACALARHAFIGLYEQRFAEVVPMLDAASRLAANGDSQLSTRYWVSAVQAEAYAGLGDGDACMRTLDAAQGVRNLAGTVTKSGWLRFDGSRLAEERGTCYMNLSRPESAHAALTEALELNISLRRQGSINSDLAMVGLQRRDLDQVVYYGGKAIALAKQTGSAGYVGRKLGGLKAQLTPLVSEPQLSSLSYQIDQLALAKI
ncbi:MAG TPA: transcriptional regulator [Streptosporangiaceae bacterium]|nr:transcriptional regulator [Streptosporangiaceae bacterium]